MYDLEHHLGYWGTGALLIVMLIVQLLYLWSLYSAMEKVPVIKRKFPSWFVWLMIIPVVGFIFAWIMEPFGIPKSFEAAAENNQPMKDDSKTLFGIGLAHMILISASFIPFIGLFAALLAFILWIVYWVKVVKFKNTHLKTPLMVINSTK